MIGVFGDCKTTYCYPTGEKVVQMPTA